MITIYGIKNCDTMKKAFGSGGPGSPHHLFGELFKSMTGTQMTHVSYRGSVPALNDVIAGHIDFMFVDFASAAGQIQGGKVRPLAVSTKARIPVLNWNRFQSLTGMSD